MISAVRIPSKALKHFNWQYDDMVYGILQLHPDWAQGTDNFTTHCSFAEHRCGQLCSVWIDSIKSLILSYLFLPYKQMISDKNKL